MRFVLSSKRIFYPQISYRVFITPGPKTSETSLRYFLYAFDHYHKIAPFHIIGLGLLVIRWCLKTAGFQALYIHYQSTILGMDEFHQFPASADKDEHVAILHTAPHALMNNTAQRTYAFTHVGIAGTKEITHRIIKAEHGSLYMKLSCEGRFLPCRH